MIIYLLLPGEKLQHCHHTAIIVPGGAEKIV